MGKNTIWPAWHFCVLKQLIVVQYLCSSTCAWSCVAVSPCGGVVNPGEASCGIVGGPMCYTV
jgi:hypothetical protein